MLRPAKLRAIPACVPSAGEIDVGGPMPVFFARSQHFPQTAAFYDEESDTLSVNILPFEPYHSFLESEDIRIDTDEHGRPVFIEVNRARERWLVDPGFAVPVPETGGTLCFRETRRRFSRGEIRADQRGENVCLKFLARQGKQVTRLGDNLLAETADGFLVAIWVLGIELDFGERKQAKWRVATAQRLRRIGHRWQCCTREKLTEKAP